MGICSAVSRSFFFFFNLSKKKKHISKLGKGRTLLLNFLHAATIAPGAHLGPHG